MRVLVGVDGSDLGLKALEEAVERGQQANDDITVAVYSPDNEPLEEIVAAVEDHVETMGLDITIDTVETEPGSQLLELAERGGYDQIVIPGGKLSPLGKLTLDSVHEFVILNARMTVRLVR